MAICNDCGSGLSENAKFCRHCGKRTSACARCGTALFADSTFCEECGAAVATLQSINRAVNPAGQPEPKEVQASSAPPSNTSPTPLPTAMHSEKVLLRNPRSGAVKQIKVGWSWTIFFFDWLALFVREMYPWAALFFGFFVVNILLRGNMAIIPIVLCELGIKVYLCIKGNELMAKQHLQNGWEFAEPESAATRYARIQWGIDTAPTATPQAAMQPASPVSIMDSGDGLAGKDGHIDADAMARIERSKDMIVIYVLGAVIIFAFIIFLLDIK